MHIGLVIYGSLDSLSGGYLFDRKLVEYLRQQGDSVDIISLPNRPFYGLHLLDNLRYRNAKEAPQPAATRKKGQTRTPPAEPVNKEPFDLIIQDELNHPSLLLANSRAHLYPVVSLVHHLRHLEQRPAWQNNIYRQLEKRYLRSVDGFIFNSQTTRGDVESLLHASKPSVIANPPTDRFGVQVTGPQVIDRGQRPVLRVLFLGNVIRRKGLHTLIDAMRMLPHPAQLDVAGALGAEPAYSREMQKRARRLGAGIPVRFHGPLDSEPLVNLLKQAHVLAIPSTYEGFGIAYLEGMGFGLPAIGTTSGAAGEVITEGVDGFLVPPDNPRLLAERLRVLARDRQQLIRMGLAALERFQRQPKWEISAEAIRHFLLKTAGLPIARGPLPPPPPRARS